MKTNLTLSDIESLIADVQQEYEKIKKSEMKEEEETKNEDALKKEDEGPKAEDSMPDVEEKQEAHMEEELEEEMNHQTVEELLAEYMKLDEDDLMAHLIACNQAVAAKMQEEKEDEMEMVEDIMEKTKPKVFSKKSFSASVMKKSMQPTKQEKELKKELFNLKNKMESLTKSFDKIVKQPKNLAFTGENFLAKSQPVQIELSKSEIISKLKEKAREQLSAEDSARLIKFNLNPFPTEELKKFLKI